MRLEDVLLRADHSISVFMPKGSVRLLTLIDPSLAYPKNLLKILQNLRSQFSLIEDRQALREILLLLKRTEADNLARRFVDYTGHDDTYDFLLSKTFSRKNEKQILLDFFGLIRPFEEPPREIAALTEVVPQFPLFAHQEKALLKIELHLQTAPFRALLHMPTGSGKTRTAMHVVVNFLRSRTQGVVVWLAHSEELCEQAAREFESAWAVMGSRPVKIQRFWGGIESDEATITDGIVIAGLKKALASLKKDGYFLRTLSAQVPLVIMDEAHQAIAPTYQTIIEQLLRPGSAAKLLGLTATPGRTWNDPESDRLLSDFFDREVAAH